MLTREEVLQVRKDWDVSLVIPGEAIVELCETCLALFDRVDAAQKEKTQPECAKKGQGEITVREIVSDWLKEHGYDGLCTVDCGCRLDDLMPCAGGGYAPVDMDAIAMCIPGHLRRCTDPDCYCEGKMEHIIADGEKADADRGGSTRV